MPKMPKWFNAKKFLATLKAAGSKGIPMIPPEPEMPAGAMVYYENGVHFWRDHEGNRHNIKGAVYYLDGSGRTIRAYPAQN